MMSPFKRIFLIQFETDFETDHFLQQAPVEVKYDFLSFVHLETGFLKDRQCKCHVETQDAISEPPFAADFSNWPDGVFG